MRVMYTYISESGFLASRVVVQAAGTQNTLV